MIKRKWEKSIFFWDLENDDLYPQLDNIKEFLIKNKISNGGLDDEELINQAITIISETRKASATMLQRKLNIWFARAARIIDVLEERWIIGKAKRNLYLIILLIANLHKFDFLRTQYSSGFFAIIWKKNIIFSQVKTAFTAIKLFNGNTLHWYRDLNKK